jgi:hypothetical protein
MLKERRKRKEKPSERKKRKKELFKIITHRNELFLESRWLEPSRTMDSKLPKRATDQCFLFSEDLDELLVLMWNRKKSNERNVTTIDKENICDADRSVATVHDVGFVDEWQEVKAKDVLADSRVVRKRNIVSKRLIRRIS